MHIYNQGRVWKIYLVRSQIVNIFSFTSYVVLLQLLNSALECRSSRRQYVDELTWLCFFETIFTKSDSQIWSWAMFVDSYTSALLDIPSYNSVLYSISDHFPLPFSDDMLLANLILFVWKCLYFALLFERYIVGYIISLLVVIFVWPIKNSVVLTLAFHCPIDNENIYLQCPLAVCVSLKVFCPSSLAAFRIF